MGCKMHQKKVCSTLNFWYRSVDYDVISTSRRRHRTLPIWYLCSLSSCFYLLVIHLWGVKCTRKKFAVHWNIWGSHIGFWLPYWICGKIQGGPEAYLKEYVPKYINQQRKLWLEKRAVFAWQRPVYFATNKEVVVFALASSFLTCEHIITYIFRLDWL